MPRPANGQKLPTLVLSLVGGGVVPLPGDLAGALGRQLPEKVAGVVTHLMNQH